MTPAVCAKLICDFLLIETAAAIDVLARHLEEQGLTVEVLLAPGSQMIEADEKILAAHCRESQVPGTPPTTRTLTLHTAALQQLLLELVDLRRWSVGIRKLLDEEDPPASPVLTFTNERATWQ